ncbi:hypothetical protein SSS_00104 [Sarcoptes scabiei]|uniref:Uncharacterized protein n=1 Tax=Sarcoptes scabiei TaxID=52283 RepID=A0A834RFZ7_SARSC|nr:hypothetical protein SSS_00104 [Sarcoptes scabiei]
MGPIASSNKSDVSFCESEEIEANRFGSHPKALKATENSSSPKNLTGNTKSFHKYLSANLVSNRSSKTFRSETLSRMNSKVRAEEFRKKTIVSKESMRNLQTKSIDRRKKSKQTNEKLNNLSRAARLEKKKNLRKGRFKFRDYPTFQKLIIKNSSFDTNNKNLDDT